MAPSQPLCNREKPWRFALFVFALASDCLTNDLKELGLRPIGCLHLLVIETQ